MYYVILSASRVYALRERLRASSIRDTALFLFSVSLSASLVDVFRVVSRNASCIEDEALRRSVSYTLQYIMGFKGSFD